MDGQLTLSELNALIKEALQEAFPEPVWIVAEIGELKVNRSGHCYLELVEKDESTDEVISRQRATIWSWQFRFIQPYFESITGQALTSGISVLLSVTIEYHEVYGISLNVKDIDPKYTLGDLARKRLETIRRLEEEGVFDMNKELEIPEIPGRIAIISSPTAAGYEDFMNQLQNNTRNYRFSTRLFAANMQGNDAPASIIAALDQIYELEDQFDVVAILRGGGSQMDLLCFDNYELALHVAQFPLPVLTGIGHERDESVVDMVAHTKLKTPTAVAEFLIQCYDNVAFYLTTLEDNFRQAITTLLEYRKNELQQATRLFKPLVKKHLEKLNHKHNQIAISAKTITEKALTTQKHQIEIYTRKLKAETKTIIRQRNHQLVALSSETGYALRLKMKESIHVLHNRFLSVNASATNLLKKKQKHLEWLDKNIELVNPSNILKRGFSITLLNGKAVKDEKELTEGQTIETILYQGKTTSTIQKK